MLPFDHSQGEIKTPLSQRENRSIRKPCFHDCLVGKVVLDASWPQWHVCIFTVFCLCWVLAYDFATSATLQNSTAIYFTGRKSLPEMTWSSSMYQGQNWDLKWLPRFHSACQVIRHKHKFIRCKHQGWNADAPMRSLNRSPRGWLKFLSHQWSPYQTSL